MTMNNRDVTHNTQLIVNKCASAHKKRSQAQASSWKKSPKVNYKNDSTIVPFAKNGTYSSNSIWNPSITYQFIWMYSHQLFFLFLVVDGVLWQNKYFVGFGYKHKLNITIKATIKNQKKNIFFDSHLFFSK